MFKLSVTIVVLVLATLQANGASVQPIKIPLSNDDMLHGPVAVGTPKQSFEFLIDTGSSTSWVMSKKFKGLCEDSVQGYDSSASKTYKAFGEKYETFIPATNFSGFLSEDTLSVGGVNVPSQVFAEIDNFPGTFMCWRKFAGSLGLGMTAKGEQTSVVDNLLERGLIPAPIVSLNLNTKSKPDEQTEGGYVLLGGIDSDKIKGDINYVPSVSESEWQVEMYDLTVKDKQELTTCANGCSASINSAIFFIYGPITEIKAINKAIGAEESVYEGDSTWTLPCSTENKPNVVLKIGRQTYTLTPKDYIIDMRSDPYQQCFSLFANRIMPSRSANWILGTKFIQKYLTVFDYAKKQIGFAAKN